MKTILDARDRAAITERIEKFSPTAPRQWGRMSAHQTICHLTDAFYTCLGDRPAKDRSTPFTRTILRFVALTTPVPWPKGVPTLPEVDQEKGGTPPTEFDADLKRLRTAMDEFVTRLDPESLSHPIFRRMSAAEWGRWAYRHVDHHARQFGL